jgi:hypothetical protein
MASAGREAQEGAMLKAAGPICEICGKPMTESVDRPRRCPACVVLQDYQDFHYFQCVRCGSQAGILKTLRHSDVCSSCEIRERFAQVPETDRQTIRAAAQQGQIPGTITARQVLGWPLSDLTDLVAMIRMGSA